jgi:metal-dependent amidase/aminoacylase/carboxypeptidase family protein
MTDSLAAASDFFLAATDLRPQTIALRRAIHEEPEIGLDTPKTLQKVKAALDGLPLALQEARSCTGLIAALEGETPGRTVLLRGGMDGLPMP